MSWGDIDFDKFREEIVEELDHDEYPTEDGWYTEVELAKLWGVKRRGLNNWLNKGIEAGIVEVATGSRMGRTCRYWANVYRRIDAPHRD